MMNQADTLVSVTVGDEHAGMRLDRCLALRFAPTLSRSHIRQMIISGAVTMNGQSVKPHMAVSSGMVIDMRRQPEQVSAPEIVPLCLSLDIIYEDEDLLVINKPAGLVVHPAAGHRQDTLVNALAAYTGSLSTVNGVEKSGIVHRLDKDTSGVMLIARHNVAHRLLAAQFKNYTVAKVYLAAVSGTVQYDEGIIDAAIGRNPANRLKMKVLAADARAAVTCYRVLRRQPGFSVLAVFPRTGRTHQIRVHCAYAGHPLLGDRVYGGHEHAPLIARQALHSYRIGCQHPRDGRYCEFSAAVPADMSKLIGTPLPEILPWTEPR